MTVTFPSLLTKSVHTQTRAATGVGCGSGRRRPHHHTLPAGEIARERRMRSSPGRENSVKHSSRPRYFGPAGRTDGLTRNSVGSSGGDPAAGLRCATRLRPSFGTEGTVGGTSAGPSGGFGSSRTDSFCDGPSPRIAVISTRCRWLANSVGLSPSGCPVAPRPQLSLGRSDRFRPSPPSLPGAVGLAFGQLGQLKRQLLFQRLPQGLLARDRGQLVRSLLGRCRVILRQTLRQLVRRLTQRLLPVLLHLLSQLLKLLRHGPRLQAR